MQQLVKEDYLRWDSLGEFFALVPSLEQYAEGHRQLPAPGSSPTPSTAPRRPSSTRTSPRPGASAASTTAAATSSCPCTGRRSWPSRPDDADLAKAFAPLAETLSANEQKIVDELNAVQGKPAEIGGYYRPDPAKAAEIMRPSATWNEALASLA